MTNPAEKLERRKGAEEEVYKYYYKVRKWISVKDLQKLVSLFSHTNSGESTVYFPISGTVLIFILSNFSKILSYIRTLLLAAISPLTPFLISWFLMSFFVIQVGERWWETYSEIPSRLLMTSFQVHIWVEPMVWGRNIYILRFLSTLVLRYTMLSKLE